MGDGKNGRRGMSPMIICVPSLICAPAVSGCCNSKKVKSERENAKAEGQIWIFPLC